ncbi:MAG: alanine racemase [Gammaproteobacteria bacterium]|nr:alanine racemase [Gammaproteobacteria bacterium]MDH5650998.1 alanine racemase [Gammaproteobacteria bacterium]
MTRATRAVIDLAAFRHNLQISRQAAPHSKQLAIIKAHAYGHGMIHAAQALDEADGFGVAILEEAIALREAGISKPIILLEGFASAADLNLIRGYRLDCVIHHVSQVEILEQASGTPIPVWLKIDTGMHRLGFPPHQANEMYQRLMSCPAVQKPLRLMTHFANADDPDDNTTEQQIKTFYESFDFDAENGADCDCSLANSAGILGWPASHAQWVRPGIMLYGVTPFMHGTGKDYSLQPVMTLQAELIAVNRFNKGDAIGYGGSWICPEEMPIGVVAIGYGDGYPRHAQSGTPVLVNGQRCQIVGRVSMDMVTVDLRNQPNAEVGDEVILWGNGLPVEEVASSAGTIAYELLCGVTNRVRFEYINQV